MGRGEAGRFTGAGTCERCLRVEFCLKINRVAEGFQTKKRPGTRLWQGTVLLGSALSTREGVRARALR